MSRKLSYPELLRLENNIELLEPFTTAKAHHKMKCLVCDHIWSATPISKRQTFKKNGVSGCPNCQKLTKEEGCQTARNETLNKLKQQGLEVLTSDYDGRRIYAKNGGKIKIHNTNCGHTFEVTPANLLSRNVTCSVCGNAKRAAQNIERGKLKQEKFRETASEWNIYRYSVYQATLQTYRKHRKQINPNNYRRGKAGVEGAYHLDHIIPVRYCFDNLIPIEVCAHHTNLTMLPWEVNVSSGAKLKSTVPAIFYPYIEHKTRIANITMDLHEMLPATRSDFQIGSFIANLFDPKLMIALFILPIDRALANSKIANEILTTCTDANIRCVIIYEDEWQTRQQIVRSKLRHIFNHSDKPIAHARKLQLRLIDGQQKHDFLNANHLQGSDKSQYAVGAFDEDEHLYAVMTFSLPRVAMGQRQPKENTWELSRFATDNNFRIPGIAARLLKFFQKHVNWSEIYSYADKRWSVGGLYCNLGFEEVANNPPQYFYIVDGVRKHRWNYRKDMLKHTLEDYRAEDTEYENMERAGYYRIWDCGTLKYTIRK